MQRLFNGFHVIIVIGWVNEVNYKDFDVDYNKINKVWRGISLDQLTAGWGGKGDYVNHSGKRREKYESWENTCIFLVLGTRVTCTCMQLSKTNGQGLMQLGRKLVCNHERRGWGQGMADMRLWNCWGNCKTTLGMPFWKLVFREWLCVWIKLGIT